MTATYTLHDACALVFVLLLLFAGSLLLAFPPTLESGFQGTMNAIETLVWSSASWIMNSQTKTQAAVRAGVTWSLLGWIIKPIFRYAIYYARRKE
jgi:hypothetical protein